MAGPDYRQVQAPEQVNTYLPDNGAAARAAALGGLFKEFEGASETAYGKIQTQAGALAGAAAGATGHPQYRQGLEKFTAYSQAFNNAATGAYAVQAEAQADAAAARLRVQSNNDPGTFAQTFSAVRDAVLKEAPAMAQPMLTELYNKHLAAGLAQISGEKATEERDTGRQLYDVQIAKQVSRVAELQGSANPQDHLAAMDEQVKLSAVIDGGVNAGLYSKAEGQARHVNTMRDITSQVFETQVDREIGLMGQTGNSGDIVKLLDNFRTAHERNLANPNEPSILSEPEFNTLMNNAKAKLTQERTELFYSKYGQKTAEEQKFEAGDRLASVMLARNTPAPTMMRTIASMMASGDLKPERGTALIGMLQRGQDAPADPRALLYAEHDPDRFNWTTDDLLMHAGGNAKGAIALTAKIESERNGWESHPPIRDAQKAIVAALKLPSGVELATASAEEKKAYVDAGVEFTNQMNKLDITKRDAEAPRVAGNVIMEMKARNAEAAAAQWVKGKAYVENTFGPKGTSPDTKKYTQGMAAADAKAKAERDQAAQLRQGIKQ